MKRALAFCVTTTVVSWLGVSEARIPGPAIVADKGGYELVLPDTMATAIQRAVPGFTVETLAAYDSDIQKYYECTSRQAPWAVVGDFDGDGIQDVIVDGHVGVQRFRLCVWGATARVDTILGQTWGQHGGEIYSSVLLYAQPGVQSSNFNESTVFIFADGYVDYFFERAGSTWYWKDGKWHEFGSYD